MAYFQYQARDAKGQSHKGVLEGASEDEVARKLKSSALYPVKIKSVRSRKVRRVPEEHVIGFFFDLSDLLFAGLPVDRALALVSTNQTHKVFRRIVEGLLEEVQGGNDLSGSLGNYRDVFGDLASHVLRAGEASGTLAPILKRLAQYLEQRRAFKQSLISSMIYPLILFSTSMLSIVILLIYVVPKFAQIFQDMNQKIPFMTQLLLDTGAFLNERGWVFPILLVLLFYGWKVLHKKPGIRKAMDRFLFWLPFSRYLILHSELTRFCRTLGTMIQAGVPLLRAISLGGELLVNSVLKDALGQLHREIKAGHSLSSYFRSNQRFPLRMGTMLRIAEEQGTLGEGLIGLGDYFEKELQRTLQRLMALMEPAVILLTGLAIAIMVMSMFTAIFGINDVKF